MDQEIKAEFETCGFSLKEEKEILNKCLTLCNNYSLKPSDLVSHWEIYYLNWLSDRGENVVESAHIDGFSLDLQNKLKEKILEETQHLHVYSSKDIDMFLNDEQQEDTREVVIGTPTREQNYTEPFDFTPTTNGTFPSSGKSSRCATNHITPFGTRTKKFDVQSTIRNLPEKENGARKDEVANHEDDVIKRVPPTERCSLEVQGSQLEPGCRFMYDRTEDKFNSLENRIRRHANAFVASGLYEEPSDPTMALQKNIFSVGMVCGDGEGRLNEKSVLLQSSVEYSGGQRVRLDLHKISQFSFFPGQVVGIEGTNPSGHCFIASRVIDSIPLSVSSDEDMPPAKKQAMDMEIQPASLSSMPGELSVVIAAGPFTTTDNLLFEPLNELLAYASRKQPQLLILLGPFVDSEHPEIKTGIIDRSYDDIFNVEILRKLVDYAEFMGPAARVVLVPSIRDATHDFVFPQPAFNVQAAAMKNQITYLTNPGVFNANKVKVSCCNVDILKQLSGEEISRIPAGGTKDRMGRLATHVLNQRSFYPLYPPSEDVPLDLSLAPEALQFSSIPDILILPSDLAPFVKVLSLGGEDKIVKCISINPGRLAKGVGGGTFVELKYQRHPDNVDASIIRI